MPILPQLGQAVEDNRNPAVMKHLTLASENASIAAVPEIVLDSLRPKLSWKDVFRLLSGQK